MDYAEINVKNNVIYRLGLCLGFLLAFLIFASMLYFLLRKFHQLPLFIRYFYVVITVIVAFAIGLLILKMKK